MSTSHPTYSDVPVGIRAKGKRAEFESMGAVDVPADRSRWTAETPINIGT